MGILLPAGIHTLLRFCFFWTSIPVPGSHPKCHIYLLYMQFMTSVAPLAYDGFSLSFLVWPWQFYSTFQALCRVSSYWDLSWFFSQLNWVTDFGEITEKGAIFIISHPYIQSTWLTLLMLPLITLWKQDLSGFSIVRFLPQLHKHPFFHTALWKSLTALQPTLKEWVIMSHLVEGRISA